MVERVKPGPGAGSGVTMSPQGAPQRGTIIVTTQICLSLKRAFGGGVKLFPQERGRLRLTVIRAHAYGRGVKALRAREKELP